MIKKKEANKKMKFLHVFHLEIKIHPSDVPRAYLFYNSMVLLSFNLNFK
jgi:hypothetical protein